MTTQPTFRCSVFIATSLDGFIARRDGDIDWLTGRDDEPGDPGESGYEEFVSGVDTLVFGRGSYEKVLTFDPWPYEGLRVVVLSTQLPADADPRVTVYRDLESLIEGLNAAGTKGVYVDGGAVVQTFLRAGFIDEMTITRVPVLIGDGLPLFGGLERDVNLTHRSTKVLGGVMVQSTYDVVKS